MEFRNENQSQTILVTNLPPTVNEVDIAKQVKGITIKSINIFREKSSGISKAFALVEFYRTTDAEYWMQITQGKLYLNGKCLQLQYTATEKKSTPEFNKATESNNWKCIHCGILYFTWEEICLNCKLPSNLNKEHLEKTSRKLMLQNLNVLTKPYHILKFIKKLSPRVADKIMNVVVERDRDDSSSSSRYVCYLSFHSKQDAVDTHDFLKHKSPLVICKTTVTLSYCPEKLPNKKTPKFAQRSVPESCNFNLDKNEETIVHNTYANVTVPTGTDGLIYNPPDYNSFVYDANSQYFYDVKTGLYFDSNTNYFYNSEIRQNLYFDETESTYKLLNIKIDIDIDIASSDKTTKKVDPKFNEKKSKIKKSKETYTPQEIVKQMERWAKKVNKKKHSTCGKKVNEIKSSPKQKDKDNDNDISFNVTGNCLSKCSPLKFNEKQMVSSGLPTSNIRPSSQVSTNEYKWDKNSPEKKILNRFNEKLEVARYLCPVNSYEKMYCIKDGGLADTSDQQLRFRQEYHQQRISKASSLYNYRQYVKKMTPLRFKESGLLSSISEVLKND